MDTPVVLRCARHGEPVLSSQGGLIDFRCVRCLIDRPPTRWEQIRKRWITEPVGDVVTCGVVAFMVSWIVVYLGVLQVLAWLRIRPLDPHDTPVWRWLVSDARER